MGIMRSVEGWLFSKLFDNGKLELSNASLESLQAELYFKELALAKVKSIYSVCLSSCILNKYHKNEIIRDNDYYLWNIRPNKNQNRIQFFDQIIGKLINDNECLVIYYNDQLLIADDFQKDEYALLKNEYSSVVVKDFSFQRKFYENEVYYFSLNDENIKRYIDGVYQSYAQILGASKEIYLDQADKHYFLNVSTEARHDPKFAENFTDMTGEKLKKFLKHGKNALPVYDGFEWVRDSPKSASTTVDYREMRKEVFSSCAEAFNIPTALMFSDTANLDTKVVDNLITFGLKKMTNMIQNEISSKNVGLSNFMDDHYEFDITKIKYFNPLENAASIEKLLGTGAYCIDEIRVKGGDKPLDTEWSKRHFMTKNFGTIEELLKYAENFGDIETIHEDDNSFKGGDE
ncbi:phage portal protein [Candidatus Stoquefichus sp. SB1]|jgi:HK97 family phage portal protein|uniref:Portal protein n=1 Tax=Siphoviridae sp. ctQtc11 TaxID=2825497 RepID=A0A8S5P5G5_9CAUD|nr:phage portal protein [Candidatus Stoquefichus sp. SB1]DAE01428.1 MAG TPA: portal protein [Siphoviridae sp. ctQtc11]